VQPIKPALGTRARVKFFNEGRAVDAELATLLLLLLLVLAGETADDIFSFYQNLNNLHREI